MFGGAHRSYNAAMSRFLRAGRRRGITVLMLALLILAVIVAVVILSRYVAV
jgi:t-SNARE complex subunit (syntaxin)